MALPCRLVTKEGALQGEGGNIYIYIHTHTHTHICRLLFKFVGLHCLPSPLRELTFYTEMCHSHYDQIACLKIQTNTHLEALSRRILTADRRESINNSISVALRCRFMSEEATLQEEMDTYRLSAKKFCSYLRSKPLLEALILMCSILQ